MDFQKMFLKKNNDDFKDYLFSLQENINKLKQKNSIHNQRIGYFYENITCLTKKISINNDEKLNEEIKKIIKIYKHEIIIFDEKNKKIIKEIKIIKKHIDNLKILFLRKKN